MDSSQVVSTSTVKGLSAEGVAGAGGAKTTPSINSTTSLVSKCLSGYQKRKQTLYPVFNREVFFVTRAYKCLGSSKRPKNFDYLEVEIEHDMPWFVELPGQVKCSNVKSCTVVCTDCGYEREYFFGNCDDPKCFACHVSWSKKKAYDDTLRVLGCLEKTEKTDGEELWHFVLSPPENAGGSSAPRDEGWLEKILRECYELCKINGISGGCAILHYGPELGKDGIEKYLPKGEYRPHVHILGCGPRPQGPWSNERGMWVVKTLNHGKAVSQDFVFIREGLHYRLSHCLRRKGKHSIRWFGSWSYCKKIGDRRKLVDLGLRKKWIERIEVYGCEVVCKCPKCGGSMVRKLVFDANERDFITLDVKPPP